MRASRTRRHEACRRGQEYGKAWRSHRARRRWKSPLSRMRQELNRTGPTASEHGTHSPH
jgi:hypothetical protein